YDLGPSGLDVDYVWGGYQGEEFILSSTNPPSPPYIYGGGFAKDSYGRIIPVLPGDIIQYRDVTITNPDGTWSTASHHTAIVERVNSDGSYQILEQNWDGGKTDGRVVAEHNINLNNMTYGHYWIYYPLPA